jgi:Domain of unknown function (DUF4365)
MDPNKQKEEFQYAYVCALAAHAGLNRGDFRVDEDSVDIMFQGKGYHQAPIRNPQIQIQLKCTSQNLINGEVIKFPLTRKNYDELRGENVVAPRYLAVLLVPDNTNEWIVYQDDHMSLHNGCFWVSLRNAPHSENMASVTVDVPLTQRLKTDSLLEMMVAASTGEGL